MRWSLKHLTKGWLTPSDTKVIARLENSEEEMNKFAIAAAKSPTIKDEVVDLHWESETKWMNPNLLTADSFYPSL